MEMEYMDRDRNFQVVYGLTGILWIDREHIDWKGVYGFSMGVYEQGVHGYYGLVLEKELKGKPLRSTHQWNREEEI